MISEFKDFMTGNVLTYKDGRDCSNNGISSRSSILCVVRENVTLEEIKEFCSKNDFYEVEMFFKVDSKFFNSHGYVRLLPVNRRGGEMAGGNYLYSYDSRFRNFVCGCEYPVPIHDRVE